MAHPGLIYDCPNCPAESQGFGYFVHYDHPAKGLNEKITTGHREFVLFKCNRCHYPVVAEIYRIVSEQAGNQPLELTATYKDQHYRVISVRPKRDAVGQTPEHTPQHIAHFFGQACRALQRGDADTAGMGFRKALDTATRHIIRVLNPPDLNAVLKRVLKQRIDWLHTQGKLTDDLKDWAHLMRDEGNDAAHEEDPYTPEEAQDLHDLTEVFLMYVFTIPGKIAEKHPNLPPDTLAEPQQ